MQTHRDFYREFDQFNRIAKYWAKDWIAAICWQDLFYELQAKG